MSEKASHTASPAVSLYSTHPALALRLCCPPSPTLRLLCTGSSAAVFYSLTQLSLPGGRKTPVLCRYAFPFILNNRKNWQGKVDRLVLDKKRSDKVEYPSLRQDSRFYRHQYMKIDYTSIWLPLHHLVSWHISLLMAELTKHLVSQLQMLSCVIFYIIKCS